MDLGLDFISLWAGGKVFADGSNPYDSSKVMQVISDHVAGVNNLPGGYHNPFYLLPILAVFGMMSYRTAATCWFLSTMSIGIFCAKNICKDQAYRFKHISGNVVSILLILLVFFPFSKHIFVGQTTIISLLGLVLATGYLRKGHYIYAGMSGSLLAVKPHLVIPLCLTLGGWAAIHNRRALCKCLLGFFLPLAILSLATIYIRPTIIPENMAGMAENYSWALGLQQVTLGYIISNATGWRQAIPLIFGLGAVLGLVLAVIPNLSLLERSIHALFIGVLFAPHGFAHDHVVLLYPFMIAVDRLLNWNYIAGILTTLFLFLICAIPFSADIFANEWISIVVPILLWVFYSYRNPFIGNLKTS